MALGSYYPTSGGYSGYASTPTSELSGGGGGGGGMSGGIMNILKLLNSFQFQDQNPNSGQAGIDPNRTTVTRMPPQAFAQTPRYSSGANPLLQNQSSANAAGGTDLIQLITLLQQLLGSGASGGE